jgi:hypothetical protein
MALFGPNPWKKGVHATATIERVMVNPLSSNTNDWDNEKIYKTYLTFRFTDAAGSEVTVERHFRLARQYLPGSTVGVAYMPGEIENSLDADFKTAVPPGAAVARGWSAGAFEIEDLGTHHSGDTVDGLQAERELFRNGRRTRATVTSADAERQGVDDKRGSARYLLALALDDGSMFTRRIWIPDGCGPNPGDLIEVAVGTDGSTLALDTDERYDAPPGRALVFTPWVGPPDRNPALPVDANAARIEAGATQAQATAQQMLHDELARAEAMHASGQLPDDAFMTAKATIESSLARFAPSLAPVAAAAAAPDDGGDAVAKLQQLAELRAAGALTEEEFAAAKAKVLGS